jgi:hypothetical protein
MHLHQTQIAPHRSRVVAKRRIVASVAVSLAKLVPDYGTSPGDLGV